MFDLTKCDICPNECGVDRRKTVGLCSANDKMIIAGYSLHFFEEPCVSGTNGSGTVFFSGCGMRCVYCQNHRISRPFLLENIENDSQISKPISPKKNGVNFQKSKLKGYEITPAELADIFKKLEELGAHNINLVSPTHFAPLIISAIKKYKPKIPIIYNTSGYEKRESISRLNDFVDIYLTDLKYADLDALMTIQNRANDITNAIINNRNFDNSKPLKNRRNDITSAIKKDTNFDNSKQFENSPNDITADISNDINLHNLKPLKNSPKDIINDIPNVIIDKANFSVAKELSSRQNYTLFALPAIAAMIRGKGKPVIKNGLIKSGVIIRHLVIPSYLENSLRVLELIAKNFKDDAVISLMSQYTPLKELHLDKKINRPLKPIEYKIILKKALKLGIDDAYIQEQASCGKDFIPDFIRE
jgi:putative pyruvate formate lyase activating enzyme